MSRWRQRWIQPPCRRNCGLSGPPAGLVLARVSYDSVAVLDTVRVWSAELSETSLSLLRSVVANSARSNLTPDERIYVVLGDSTAGPAVRRVSRFVTCAPALLERTNISNRIEVEARRLGISERLSVSVLVFVKADGSVGDVRIAESSGNGQADLAAGRVLLSARFRPAAMEGIKVPVWARFPVTFTPRR